MGNLLNLDVSELEAPQPLENILETLKLLDSDSKLKVLHRIEPKGLYPYLKDKYNYQVTITPSGKFEITIWQKNV